VGSDSVNIMESNITIAQATAYIMHENLDKTSFLYSIDTGIITIK